jgi:hypothetical protein
MFVWLVADSWCWFVLREKYCWLVAGGWFVLREKYCWLVADKPNEEGEEGVSRNVEFCLLRASVTGPRLPTFRITSEAHCRLLITALMKIRTEQFHI